MHNIDKTEVFNGIFTGAPIAASFTDGSLERITPDKLHDFHTGEDGHVFDVEYDEDMKELEAKIDEAGEILEPLIVRPDALYAGEYEVIAGHRRKFIGLKKGFPDFLCVVRNYSDADAIKLMVSTNLDKRKKLKRTTLAKAYKAYMDANKMQGKRRDETCVGNQHKLKTRELAAEEFGVSAWKIQQTIRLCYLIKPLQDLVDSGRLAENIAVELSYCTKETQDLVAAIINSGDRIEGNRISCSLEDAKIFRQWSSQKDFFPFAQDVYAVMEKSSAIPKPKAVNNRSVTRMLPMDMREKPSDERLAYLKAAIAFYEKNGRPEATEN